MTYTEKVYNYIINKSAKHTGEAEWDKVTGCFMTGRNQDNQNRRLR